MQKGKESTGLFDALKITKYWKNQIPPKDLSSPFVDSYFPPQTSSLHGLNSKGEFIDATNGPKKVADLNPSAIEWKRVSDVIPVANLFDEKIEFDDIKQGNLGNCYFLSSIAALSEFPFLLFQIFRTKNKDPLGYYEMVFFIDGEWQIVFVDDYLPFEKGTNNFKFAKPNGLELWVVILEKAWAKINSGYSLTISGWPSDPLSALTGFSTEKITHKDIPIDELWKIIYYSDTNNQIMCTSTKNDGTVEKLGLVTNHAYTLIGAKDYTYEGKNIRLIRIRNPWGYKEWSGDWSDNSPLWNDELKKVFDQVKGDDGTFYMSIEDFVKFYECSHICYIMYDCNIKSLQLTGNDLRSPQVFNIFIDQDSRTAFSLIFRHWRFNRHLIDKDHPATMLIGRYDKDDNILDVDGVYSSIDSLEFIRNLKKGYYVIWLYLYSEGCDPVPDQAIFRCYSTNGFKFLHCGADPTFKIAKKIILEGIKEKDAVKYKADPNQYLVVENQFKKTGLGYRAIFNKDKEKYQKWEFDGTKHENETIFPPYTGMPSFTMFVPPKSERVLLGLRTKTYGSFWFNVPCKYFICSGKVPKEAESENFSPSFLQGFLQEDFIFHDQGNNYYDYHSSSLDVTKIELKFEHLDVNEVTLDKLKAENKTVMNLLLGLTALENGLTWNKLNHDNGSYLGEFNKDNQRHGRGCYTWTEGGTFYVGYWEKGIKTKFGTYYYQNNFKFYEGEFSKGVKHGKGTQFYQDKSQYVGSFVNDKRHGKGKFTWSDGSYWEGPFVDGQFHGKGIYSSPEDDEPFECEYENGKIKN